MVIFFLNWVLVEFDLWCDLGLVFGWMVIFLVGFYYIDFLGVKFKEDFSEIFIYFGVFLC